MALALHDYRSKYSSQHSDLYEILKERIKRERDRSTVIDNWNGELFLQENLMMEIFSWLPVKALLQFKTVCKSCSKHLKNYYDNIESSGDCLLAIYVVSSYKLSLFQLLVDESETPKIIASEELDDIPLGMYICGPCDGIYYVYHGSDDNARGLWNPATNELKVLPPLIMKPNLPSHLSNSSYEKYGFGFDQVSEDYKVVVINKYICKDDFCENCNIGYPLSVVVYSLRTDSWRYWGDLTQAYYLHFNRCYICVDGCFYWLGSCEDGANIKVIISFDMGNDTCKEINVPNYEQPAYNCLGVYHDSIAIFTIHAFEKHFDIWTLNEGLWIKTFSMGPLLEIQNPVGHWNNNKIILEREDRELVLLDTEKREYWNLAFSRGRTTTTTEGVFVYKDSLVSFKKARELLGAT